MKLGKRIVNAGHDHICDMCYCLIHKGQECYQLSKKNVGTVGFRHLYSYECDIAKQEIIS